MVTSHGPCPIGRYKVCFNPACTHDPVLNSVIDIGSDPASLECTCTDSTQIIEPCNCLRIQTGFYSLLNEEFSPYVKIENDNPDPIYFKEVDTLIFKVKIECGV